MSLSYDASDGDSRRYVFPTEKATATPGSDFDGPASAAASPQAEEAGALSMVDYSEARRLEVEVLVHPCFRPEIERENRER